jgi:putative membrane protein
MKNNRVFFSFLLLTLLGVFLWSSNAPRDRFTWYLEAAPAITALTLLLLTYRRFPFTRLAYALMWAHAIILLIVPIILMGSPHSIGCVTPWR